MPDQRRFEKTIEKTRLGGLPAPTDDAREVSLGDGTPCNGCGETVEPSEGSINIGVCGMLTLRFHEACYTAWTTFKRASLRDTPHA
jgi:hypothetical protein